MVRTTKTELKPAVCEEAQYAVFLMPLQRLLRAIHFQEYAWNLFHRLSFLLTIKKQCHFAEFRSKINLFT